MEEKRNTEIFSLVLKGSKNSGKSTTIREICRNLNPAEIHELDVKKHALSPIDINKIFNSAYVISVNGKNLLIIAGAPTEQKLTITQIWNACVKMNITISFILAARRSTERTAGFNTINELKIISRFLGIEIISHIDSNNFMETPHWHKRIEKILNTIINHIN